MACDKTNHHPIGATTQGLINIIPYKLTTTNDQLTSRAGLLTIAQLMNTLILMQHEGSFHLDDVRHLEQESALIKVLGIDKLPKRIPLVLG